MPRRSLLRPLPFFIIFVFVAVAGIDLVQTLREEPPPPPVVLTPGAVRFEAWEPVVDFRSGHRAPGVAILPTPVRVGELWSEPDESGTWMLGSGAELDLDLISEDLRLLIFEGRPAGGKRPVRRVGLTVNGVDCGETRLVPAWQRWSVKVPGGVLRNGLNTIVFSLPDREQARRPRRALQLRHMELLADRMPGSGGAKLDPVTVDFETQRVVMRTPGVFEARFAVDDRTDALRLKYRFRGSGGEGEMTVARPQGGGVGRDAEVRRVLASSARGVNRVRVPLHGRRGDFVLRLATDPGIPQFQLDLRSLELVTERNRSVFRGDLQR